MPPKAQGLLNETMAWLDTWYDPSAGYLYDCAGSVALRHETRSSAWYALGLLARNNGSDAVEAERIVRNIIQAQFKNEQDQWYGDYEMYPGQPQVGSSVYPAVIYNSWDPNWRGFVGTTFIMILEEFGELLSDDTQEMVLESLYNTTKGDTYRVGGVDDDNLYPSYSNPAIMRAFVSGWTGRRLTDSNMTASGEMYAQEIIDLFTMYDTLSEFNSGTYTGVSLFGLLLWSKYLPNDSVMTEYGPKMLQDTWKAVEQLWHPGFKNMVGPWDRAYGFDMNRYVSLMGLWFWALIGKDKSSIIEHPQDMSHSPDWAWGPPMAVLAGFHETLIPNDTLTKLETFSGEHIFTASAYYPPYDLKPRNITTWLSENLTIGGESYTENVLGGPSESQGSFNPAIIHWNTGDEINFLSWYATEMALEADVSPGKLNLTYPQGNASSTFTFVVGTFKKVNMILSWEDLQGLNVTLSGNVNASYSLSFAGQLGGSGDLVRDFEFWNFTYTMPSGFEGIPNICLELKLSE
ncbi:uncharacterized protein BCR38DRAFT_459944 [Pseudomassariella vexata]|uniref:Uncharacterized protein n=1 Tax=Pseudomassariella vexata TaxID=1141098 RepID=A0A1Y2DQW1_9PEZI|nr:uncharacterized protein BCR38DRAFT_459944 [Pseudomassariella vexata]ORY61035.1 hypothetical protein BCR38DRAFT_459944 [Pseudomassariella vexata]